MIGGGRLTCNCPRCGWIDAEDDGPGVQRGPMDVGRRSLEEFNAATTTTTTLILIDDDNLIDTRNNFPRTLTRILRPVDGIGIMDVSN